MKEFTFLTGNMIYVNENDLRSLYRIQLDKIYQSVIYDFWQKALNGFEPTVVLDVGLNYGEFLFSGTYSPNTVIIGIEANRALAPYIEKSLAAHPNQPQIKIVYEIASDQDNQSTKFFINPEHSGLSNAMPDPESHSYQIVNSVTVDSVMKNVTTQSSRLLFKIDVEGYEEKVLKGMIQQITIREKAIGCIEFTPMFMERMGINGDDYLNFLGQYFRIYHPIDFTSVVHLQSLKMQNLMNSFRPDFIQTDLILAKHEASLIELGYQITSVI